MAWFIFLFLGFTSFYQAHSHTGRIVQNDHVIKVGTIESSKLDGGSFVVISDIDDTIKRTNTESANYIELLRNALSTENSFFGMAELFELLESHGAEFYYVSASPKWPLQTTYERFLVDAGFAPGFLYQRDSIRSSFSFKYLRISQILEETEPSVVVLLGDDSSADRAVYKKLRETHSNIVFYEFIRKVYNHKILQRPVFDFFVTPAEILERLGQVGVVDSTTGKELVKLWDRHILDNLEHAVPDWVNCKGFTPNWAETATQAYTNLKVAIGSCQ